MLLTFVRGEQTLSAIPEVDFPKRGRVPKCQTAADQQRQGDGELADDQSAAETAPPAWCGRRRLALLQGFVDGYPGSRKGRRQSKSQRG